MSKNRTLEHQFQHCIKENCLFGVSRKGYKDRNFIKRNGMCNKIFSYDTRDLLLRFAKIFSNFLKVTYDIKLLTEITPAMVQEFFNEKNRKGNSYRTLKDYACRIRKLECLAQFTFKREMHFYNSSIYIGEKKRKIRDKEIKFRDFQLMLSKLDKSSDLYKCMKVAFITSCRVQNLTQMRKKDFHFNYNFTKCSVTMFQSKGGLSYTVENKFISQEEAKYLHYLVKDKKDDELIFPEYYRNRDELHRQLRNLKEICNLTETYWMIGWHGIRKLRARTIYNMLKTGKIKNRKGENFKDYECIVLTERNLGHLPDGKKKPRMDLAGTYFLG